MLNRHKQNTLQKPLLYGGSALKCAYVPGFILNYLKKPFVSVRLVRLSLSCFKRSITEFD
jgi:hypothetical protein